VPNDAIAENPNGTGRKSVVPQRVCAIRYHAKRVPAGVAASHGQCSFLFTTPFLVTDSAAIINTV